MMYRLLCPVLQKKECQNQQQHQQQQQKQLKPGYLLVQPDIFNFLSLYPPSK